MKTLITIRLWSCNIVLHLFQELNIIYNQLFLIFSLCTSKTKTRNTYSSRNRGPDSVDQAKNMVAYLHNLQTHEQYIWHTKVGAADDAESFRKMIYLLWSAQRPNSNTWLWLYNNSELVISNKKCQQANVKLQKDSGPGVWLTSLTEQTCAIWLTSLIEPLDLSTAL